MPTYPLIRVESSLRVKVGIAPANIYAGRENPPQTFDAVIDTGADVSVISPAVVKAMRVPDLGRAPVFLSGGKTLFASTYDVLLRLGGHETSGVWYPRIVNSTIPASEGVDVILGMDVLIGLKFGWDGRQGLGTGSITDHY